MPAGEEVHREHEDESGIGTRLNALAIGNIQQFSICELVPI